MREPLPHVRAAVVNACRSLGRAATARRAAGILPALGPMAGAVIALVDYTGTIVDVVTAAPVPEAVSPR